jgi:ribosomal protein L16/L10AE
VAAGRTIQICKKQHAKNSATSRPVALFLIDQRQQSIHNRLVETAASSGKQRLSRRWQIIFDKFPHSI